MSIKDIIKEAVREKLYEEVHDHGGGYTSQIHKTRDGVVTHVNIDKNHIGTVLMTKDTKGKTYRATHHPSNYTKDKTDYESAINHVIRSHDRKIKKDLMDE